MKFKLKLRQLLARESEVVIDAPNEDAFTEYVQHLLHYPENRSHVSTRATAWSDAAPIDGPGNGVMVSGWDELPEDSTEEACEFVNEEGWRVAK